MSKPLDPRRERAVPGDLGIARVDPEVRRQRERDVEPVGRQYVLGAVGPFQQHHGILGRLVDTKLGQFARMGHPIEVGMHHGEARQRVGLHQREGRARHVERVVARQMPDQRARERGLTRAEVARERDEVAGLEDRGDIGREPARRPLIREHDREAGKG